MQKSKLQLYGPFVIVLLIVIGWALFFNYVSPATLVAKLGAQNSYFVAFLLAIICGFSSLTGSTFYVTIAALAHGGANPFVLGIAGGVGLCISDYAFYYFLCKGTHIIDTHWKKLTSFIKKYANIVPDWALYVFVFIYSGFFPVPNDILLAALALSGTKFKKIAPYLFAGDVVSTLLLAYLAH